MTKSQDNCKWCSLCLCLCSCVSVCLSVEEEDCLYECSNDFFIILNMWITSPHFFPTYKKLVVFLSLLSLPHQVARRYLFCFSIVANLIILKLHVMDIYCYMIHVRYKRMNRWHFIMAQLSHYKTSCKEGTFAPPIFRSMKLCRVLECHGELDQRNAQRSEYCIVHCSI